MKKTRNEKPARNSKIYKMYLKGKTIGEIAEKMDESLITVRNIVEKEMVHEQLKKKYSNILFDRCPLSWQEFLAIVRFVNNGLDRESTEKDVLVFLAKPDEVILKAKGIGPKTLESIIKWRKAYERRTKNNRK